MESNEKIARLPLAVQKILQKKSSKHPGTRFTSKLSVLLSFVEANPHTEDEIGVAWVSETVFKMKKSVLAELMKIKINTLNVNLRDLDFRSVDSNKDGWTKWTKSGFTRSSLQHVPIEIENNKLNSHESSHHDAFPNRPTISLGCFPNSLLYIFHHDSIALWQKIIHPTLSNTLFPDFVNSCAQYFKLPDQTFEEARSLIKFVLPDKHQINFTHFQKFMSLFGPEKTVMDKLQSLLNTSKSYGTWLSFNSNQIVSTKRFVGYIDSKDANAVVITKGGLTTKIWNLPLLDSSKDYLIDESCRLYHSWSDYFTEHPLAIENIV